MHSFTTKRLLHLISIPFFPSPTSALLPVFPSQPFGCQYPSATYGTYIYFTSPNDTNFAFAIHTGWKQYYPTALRATLILADFRLADAPREHDRKTLCKWQALDNVSIRGWHRGDFIAKDLSSRNRSITTSSQNYIPTNPSPLPLTHRKQSDWRLSTTPKSALGTPPHASSPDAETLSRVHYILLTNYPGADIAMFILETASAIFWAVALTLILVAIISVVTRHVGLSKVRTEEVQLQQRQRERLDGVEDEGIELATLIRRDGSEPWKVSLPAVRKLSFPKPCLGAIGRRGRGGQVQAMGRETPLDGATLRDV